MNVRQTNVPISRFGHGLLYDTYLRVGLMAVGCIRLSKVNSPNNDFNHKKNVLPYIF